MLCVPPPLHTETHTHTLARTERDGGNDVMVERGKTLVVVRCLLLNAFCCGDGAMLLDHNFVSDQSRSSECMGGLTLRGKHRTRRNPSQTPLRGQFEPGGIMFVGFRLSRET